eukprot:3668865-Pleurochrysis_carterae.AAC.1
MARATTAAANTGTATARAARPVPKKQTGVPSTRLTLNALRTQTMPVLRSSLVVRAPLSRLLYRQKRTAPRAQLNRRAPHVFDSSVEDQDAAELAKAEERDASSVDMSDTECDPDRPYQLWANYYHDDDDGAFVLKAQRGSLSFALLLLGVHQ